MIRRFGIIVVFIVLSITSVGFAEDYNGVGPAEDIVLPIWGTTDTVMLFDLLDSGYAVLFDFMEYE